MASERSPRRGDQATPSVSTTTRAALLISVLLVMLTLVALSSRGLGLEPSEARPAASVRTVSGAPAEYGVLLLVVAAAAGSVLLLVALLLIVRPRKKEDEELTAARVPAKWWLDPLLLLLIAAVFAVTIAVLPWASHHFGSQVAQRGNRIGAGAHGSAQAGGGGQAGVTTSPAWDWTPVAVTAGAAVLAGLLLLLTRDRLPLPALTREHREDVVEAIEESIDDLRLDPDPRHAVIAAYTRMESVLARGGSPRPTSAAPLEYLDEALRRLSVPVGPARALTELFEIARFSHHRVDVTMKERAIGALVAVRDSLGVEAT
jgi:Domain of unknown function (DUF4129)